MGLVLFLDGGSALLKGPLAEARYQVGNRHGFQILHTHWPLGSISGSPLIKGRVLITPFRSIQFRTGVLTGCSEYEDISGMQNGQEGAGYMALIISVPVLDAYFFSP
jgi:hypothetical protein